MSGIKSVTSKVTASNQVIGVLGFKGKTLVVFRDTLNKLFFDQFLDNQLVLENQNIVLNQNQKSVSVEIISGSLSYLELEDKNLIWFKAKIQEKHFKYTVEISDDFRLWEVKSVEECSERFETNLILNQRTQNLISFHGINKIYQANYSDYTTKTISTSPVFELRPNFFDFQSIEPRILLDTPEGFLLIYQSDIVEEGLHRIQFGKALFSKNNTEFCIFRDHSPIYTHNQSSKSQLSYVGFVVKKGILEVYLTDLEDNLYHFEVELPYSKIINRKFAQLKKLNLSKPLQNPVLSPVENDWEALAVFNPAAIEMDGKVHLFYRAQGYDSLSVIGYASSSDGINFDERLDYPIYQIQLDQPISEPSVYCSGGGMGGVEDPRVTVIDGRLYMLYALYNGWEQARLAMTSISIEDFIARKWNWTPYQYMSPKPTVWGTGNKSGALFPEKINGKYVILHRIWPNISIDYVDDLDFSSEQKWLEAKDIIPPRQGMWDSAKLGAGAPPIKTPYGWLLIYQSVGKQDGKYKIGAMLLDLENPAKVLHRSQNPIVEPEDWYETTGLKPGVAYPCGAVIKNGQLFVYYGAADNVICVATAEIEQFMHDLMHEQDIQPMHQHPLFPR